MNIIFGWSVIIFSAYLTIKYKPKKIQSLLILTMAITTGIIGFSVSVPENCLIRIFTYFLQIIIIVCYTMQLKKENEQKKIYVKRKSISVTPESRGVNNKDLKINELPTVTAS